MERIRVLHLITHLGNGGGLDNTLLTVEGLSRDRYEVDLAAGELEPGEDYSDWEARSRQSADGVFIFPELRRPVQLLRDLRALARITRFIRSRNYQIVHTHCAKAGVLGRIAARRAGVPVVVHTCHAFGWQVAHRFHSSFWRNQVSRLLERLYVALERYAASLSDALITVAELNRKEAIARRIAPPERFVTIYSGINMDHCLAPLPERSELRARFGLATDPPVVGMVGRLSTQKAPLDFVAAAKRVLIQKPTTQFVIAGDGPLAAKVREAIGSEQRIRMLGFVDKVPELLASLDVFSLSSLWEGLGRALTEALIMGLPVAATRVGGVPELVVHGETGLLSPPGDVAHLAENILWLLDHPQEARLLGARAKQRVLPLFSSRRMVEQTEILYERLMAEKHPAASLSGVTVR